MNEIEKLYENAGIEKCNRLLKPCPFGNECDGCEHYWYPEFTAEKQLELIKLLAIKGDFAYTVDIAKNTEAYWTIYFDDSRWTAEDFEEALAGLINQLWQKLTEEEKEQIRSMLND